MSESLRGQFLIAGRNLRDPNFYKTVVLIVEHAEGGAMGVVVNRPSGVTISSALKKHFALPETGEMVYFGGPVERNALFVLHNLADLDEADFPVVPGLFVGNSPEAFEGIVRRASAGDEALRFRIYFGCAGWGADQLEGELARNDWLVYPGNAETVFDANPYEVWERLVAEQRSIRSLLPGFNGDPGTN
jgi:putative transcriptional regulator